jgi:hypothetical protein
MTSKLLICSAGAAVLFAAAAVAGVGRPGTASGAAGTSTPSRLVTASGHGTVTVVPDQALVSAGVVTHATAASAALAQNAREMQQVIAALKAAGGSNLQTEQVSLYPQTNEQGAVTGYTAQNSVSAKTAIAKAGALIDAAVGAGANSVSGPSMSTSDRDSLYRKALEQAVADARANAEALAHAGGFAVGPVFSVAENGAAAPPMPYAAVPVAAKSEATPVEPGTEDVTADVTVSFEIK